MKMFPKVITGAFGIAAALALTSSAQANLLVDPGFESGAAAQPNPIPIPGGANGGWAVFNGATYSAAAKEFGSWGMLEPAGAAWNFAAPYQVISGVSAGQKYTLTADFNTPTGIHETDPSWLVVCIQLTYFNASGTDLGTVETGGVGAFASKYMPAAANTWYTGTVTATAPAGAVYVAPYLAFQENNTGQASDTLYYDNASLTLVPEPTTVGLLGMAFAFPLYLIRRRK